MNRDALHVHNDRVESMNTFSVNRQNAC